MCVTRPFFCQPSRKLPHGRIIPVSVVEHNCPTMRKSPPDPPFIEGWKLSHFCYGGNVIKILVSNKKNPYLSCLLGVVHSTFPDLAVTHYLMTDLEMSAFFEFGKRKEPKVNWQVEGF